MFHHAKLDHIRITPRKLGLIADAVRGKSVYEAYRYLSFSPRKKAASVVLSVIQNALANNKVKLSASEDFHFYMIEEILVGPAKTIKRFIPRAKGSGSALLKRTCNLSLTIFGWASDFSGSANDEHVHDENCHHEPSEHVHDENCHHESSVQDAVVSEGNEV
jgi:large subunit ribosomal protein L22